jgi:preprotein translocase subunit Sec61beta
MMGLKALKIDPESQKQMGYKLYADAGEWITSTIRPEWIVIVCVLIAVMLYFWCRPRQKSKFWDLETVS